MSGGPRKLGKTLGSGCGASPGPNPAVGLSSTCPQGGGRKACREQAGRPGEAELTITLTEQRRPSAGPLPSCGSSRTAEGCVGSPHLRASTVRRITEVARPCPGCPETCRWCAVLAAPRSREATPRLKARARLRRDAQLCSPHPRPGRCLSLPTQPEPHWDLAWSPALPVSTCPRDSAV